MRDHRQTIKQATIGIALLVLASKAIGFIREMIIAYRFGTGIDYDVYLIAVSVPIALFTLTGYAFSNLFIPRYSYAVSGAEPRQGLRVFWTDVNLSMVAAVIVAIGIIAVAPRMIRLIAPGLDPTRLPEAVFIARVSSVVVVLGVIEAFFRSVLNAEKKFLVPAAGPIIANLVVITSILLFAGRISTRAILYGIVAGYTVQVLFVFIPFTGTGILASIHARILRRKTGIFLATAIVILTIEGASQVYAVIDRYFASSMTEGIVSALGYAYMLGSLPAAVFAYALSTALFPYMTDASAQADADRSAHLITRGICVALLLACPATMIIWVFADKLVLLLLKRGAFDMQSVAYTSDLLRYFGLGLAGQFLIWVLSRAYYAGRRYTLLIVHVLVVVAAKIIFSILGINAFGYIGLAVASSISYSVGALILLGFAGRLLVRVDGNIILVYVVKVLIASAAGFAAASFLYDRLLVTRTDFVSLLWSLPVCILLALAVSVVAGYILNISDLRHALSKLLWRQQDGGDEN